MMLLGDITNGVKDILWKQMSRVIERYAHLRDIYWILVIIKDHYNGPKDCVKQTMNVCLKGQPINITLCVIKNKSQLPAQRQLGTALWRINNQTGENKCLYVLPIDRPITQDVIWTPESSRLIEKSVQGIPLVH
jgi:hypothetical protein